MMQHLHKFLLVHFLACFRQNALGSHIIHGKKVPDSLMLYMASVQNNGNHVCGGFLISEEFVLTAAHCDKNNPISVVLGTHNLQKVDNDSMRFDVKTCKHPDFVTVSGGNDIMLLKLSRKIKFKSNRVQPVQLPKPNSKIKDKAKCRVAGWGFTKTRGKAVNVLHEVDVRTINQEVCKNEWNEVPASLPANVICAGGYTKNGFCNGDSGGPLVCGGAAVGVVSFNMRNDCDYPNVPNIYTDISKYLPWIKDILKKKDC